MKLAWMVALATGVLPVAFVAMLILGTAFGTPTTVGISLLVVLPSLIGIVGLAVSMYRESARKVRGQVIARAEYEHQALMRGDTRTGMYGRWQPPRL
jgi:hypothetical protein